MTLFLSRGRPEVDVVGGDAEELDAAQAIAEFQAHIKRGTEGATWFCRDILGQPTWGTKYGPDLQAEMIAAVFKHRRVVVPGCVSSSKTNGAAKVVLAWLNANRPAKVFTTAPTHRQVELALWGEIRGLHRKALVPLGGKPNLTEWKLEDDWYAIGFATDEPSRVQGLHGVNLLFIVDEGQGIKEPMWEAIENVMADGMAHILMLQNPSALSGTAHAALTSQAHLWHCIQIPADKTPNYRAGRIVIPGMQTKDQAQEWIRRYGWDSDFVRVKVRAILPKQEPDSVIPFSWCDAAQTRVLPDQRAFAFELGADPARFGDDNSVICAARGRQVLPLDSYSGIDTMEFAAHIWQKLRDNQGRLGRVGGVGVGGGVVDRLKQLQAPVAEISENEKPKDEAKFFDMRSEMWWHARESLNPENPECMALPQDIELVGELSACKFRIDPGTKRIRVESKKELKKRIGKSPDKADAYCYLVYGRGVGRDMQKTIDDWAKQVADRLKASGVPKSAGLMTTAGLGGMGDDLPNPFSGLG